MTTTRERLDDFESRLTGIEKHQPASAPKVQPAATGWKKYKWHIGIAIAALTLFYPVYSDHKNRETDDLNLRTDRRIDDKLDPVNTKLADVSERLARIEGKLNLQIAQKALSDATRYARDRNTPKALEAPEAPVYP